MINPSIIGFIRQKYVTIAIQNTTSYTMSIKDSGADSKGFVAVANG